MSFDIPGFLKETDADGALVVNLKGELIEVKGVDNSENIAAMIGVIMKMINDFSSDIGIGNLKQLLFKADEGIFIINKLDKKNILGIYSKDIGKAGLIMMTLNKLI